MNETQALAAIGTQMISIKMRLSELTVMVEGSLGKERSISPLALVAETVALHGGVKVSELRGEKRHRQLADTRAIAMYLSSRLLAGYSLARVGNYYRRHHTTVMHANQRVRDWQDTKDPRAVRVEAPRLLLQDRVTELLGAV